jgi:hypothetical protein
MNPLGTSETQTKLEELSNKLKLVVDRRRAVIQEKRVKLQGAYDRAISDKQELSGMVAELVSADRTLPDGEGYQDAILAAAMMTDRFVLSCEASLNALADEDKSTDSDAEALNALNSLKSASASSSFFGKKASC